MVTVLLGAVVSIGIAAFALSVILREFQTRWSQVVAALMFDERAVGGDFRPVASSHRMQPAPARVYRHSSRRVAA